VAPSVCLRLIPKSEWRRRLPASLMSGFHRPSASTFPTKPIIGVPKGWVVSGSEDHSGVPTVEVNEPSQHSFAHASLIVSQSDRRDQRRRPSTPVLRQTRLCRKRKSSTSNCSIRASTYGGQLTPRCLPMATTGFPTLKWTFQPGSIVRCERQSDGLIAVEAIRSSDS
jgi:hypothetical protein